MSYDKVRDILLSAVSAAYNGFQPPPAIAAAISTGDRTMVIGQLGFDSLAWMEFCISVELQSGQELTPDDVTKLRYVFELEEWLRARL